MLDRRTGLLLLGAGAAGIYATQSLWVPNEVEFTRAAPPAVQGLELRPAVSTAHVTLPIDLSRVARRTEVAFAQRLAMGLDAVDPNCIRRSATPDCAAPKLDGALALTGPVEAAFASGVIRVRLPLKYDGAPGNERSTLETALSFVFKVHALPGAGFEIGRVEEAVTEGVNGPQARTIRLIETRLKPLALTAQDELRTVLASLPVATATQQAWNALLQPIELGVGSGTWLKAAPEVIGAGQLAGSDGKAILRIPVAARLSIETGDKGPAAPRRAVVYGQVNTAGGVAIRTASPVRLEAVEQAIHAAFVKAGPHETRPDRFGPPVKVDVKRTRLYRSVRQLAVELDISASRFEGQTYHGKAHLFGRPVLDLEQRLITLADIAFPPAPQREAATAKLAAGAPRLATDPFAGKLAGAVRIDIGRDLSEAVPRFNGLLHQRLDERLSLAAKLDTAKPIGVEVARDGTWLVSELTGALTIAYDGPAETVQTATVTERAVETASAIAATPRRIATPEIAAAAVVTAAAGATAAQIAKPAAGGLAQQAATPATASSMPTAAATAATAESTAAATPAPNKLAAAKRPVVKTSGAAARHTAGAQKAAARTTTPTGRSDWVPFASNHKN